MAVKKKKKKVPKQNKMIRKGDTVMVTAGNYKGQSGAVLRRTEERVVVQGVNVRKKHVKKSQENPNGGVLEIELPIHVSNVMISPDGETKVKLKVKKNEANEKILVYSQKGKEKTYRELKKAPA